MKFSIFGALAAASTVLACPGHENSAPMGVMKRQDGAPPPPTDWAYEASFNWGRINKNYTLCQTGTQQSPIALSLSNGLSQNHRPTFNYPTNVTGNFFNWGYGPAFTITHPEGVFTGNPSFTYDNKTVYMDDPFFTQLPPMIGFSETGTQVEVTLDLNLALDGVAHFNEFWTYQGSLTSPPCHEGIRWFVARQTMFAGVTQMQALLGASTYSARAEQEVWQHRINE
ncbi:hypothetical protein HYQ46_008366 [Verticillium longisporum]|nr:hypothetical protein HYQ46_008366 [Verticillium longisporum]